jgi:hypothetical protein
MTEASYAFTSSILASRVRLRPTANVHEAYHGAFGMVTRVAGNTHEQLCYVVQLDIGPSLRLRAWDFMREYS